VSAQGQPSERPCCLGGQQRTGGGPRAAQVQQRVTAEVDVQGDDQPGEQHATHRSPAGQAFPSEHQERGARRERQRDVQCPADLRIVNQRQQHQRYENGGAAQQASPGDTLRRRRPPLSAGEQPHARPPARKGGPALGSRGAKKTQASLVAERLGLRWPDLTEWSGQLSKRPMWCSGVAGPAGHLECAVRSRC